MNTRKTLNLLIQFLFLASFSFYTFAAEDGTPFAVNGEQMDYSPPSGWKLAWMHGKQDGPFIAEYIPENEDINAWREGYLSMQRFEYPSVEMLHKLKENKTRIADMGLIQTVNKANETCGGQHTPMSQRTNTFNNVYFAVGGGYCDKYGTAAPYGEGSFVAFAEGKKFFYRIQYSWRPKSADDQKSNLPWRITPSKAKEYLESIKAMSLCGGDEQPACKVSYAR